MPPNQCSRPTELIPAKGFFVASIFSTRFRWNARVRARGRIAFPYQSATNQPSMSGFLARAMNTVQFFIIFNTSACVRARSFSAFIPCDEQWQTRYAIRARATPVMLVTPETLHRYPQAEFRSSFDSQPLRINGGPLCYN